MKFLLLTLFIAASLSAQGFSTRYDVNVGMFGRVGYSDLTLKEDGNNYEAKLVAKTVDIAATLLGNRVETFTSTGKIVNGIYIPHTFVKTKITTRKTRVETYYFDHDKKEVKVIEKKSKLVNETGFDSINFKITTQDVIRRSKKESMLKSYIKDDVLSSYLNTKTTCKAKEKFYNLVAIGAHNDKNIVTLSCLEDRKKTTAATCFSDHIKNIYNLHVEPIDKNEAIVDVLIAFDADGLMKEAILGDVFWIGKITANRVYYRVTRK